MAAPEIVALIMAGGSGTRFWPASRPHYPKQFLSLTGEHSLIADTAHRISPLVSQNRIFICSAESQAPLLKKALPEIKDLILEPAGRNTAACLMLSTLHLLAKGVSPDAVMVVLPADHYIENANGFRSLVGKAAEFAAASRGLITLGIQPTSPHTGYGYIETGEASGAALKVKRFVEKPTRERAEEFLRQKNFYWNSGIFLWTLAAIKTAFERYMPTSWRALSDCKSPAELAAVYAKLDSVPIDIGVMEKADNLYLFPAIDLGWSDIGSWDALYQLKTEKPGANVVVSGNVKTIEASGCLVKVPGDKKVALVGVSDLIVVESDGILLIVHRSADQKVKEASKAFEG